VAGGAQAIVFALAMLMGVALHALLPPLPRLARGTWKYVEPN